MLKLLIDGVALLNSAASIFPERKRSFAACSEQMKPMIKNIDRIVFENFIFILSKLFGLIYKFLWSYDFVIKCSVTLLTELDKQYFSLRMVADEQIAGTSDICSRLCTGRLPRIAF
ncbi:MAG: hypothetical protein IJC34_06850 [Lentisphaeria bacterium]|nr:hypothetical protein [Lentisphaeria bacterium]